MRHAFFYLTLWQERASWNTSRVVSDIWVLFVCLEKLVVIVTDMIAQNEWTSYVIHRADALVIHDRRSGKLKCTSALIKLRIREERTTLCPPALIQLIFVTFSAPDEWDFENE